MSNGPVFFLSDADGKRTPIRIERAFSVADASGSATSFDEMLKTYLGGYTGSHVPRTTLFNLRGIPPGSYELYLYGAQKDGASGTDFHVQLNAGTPVVKSVAPVSTTQFSENDNYARFNLVLSSVNDVVHVTVVGFINGLQLKRV